MARTNHTIYTNIKVGLLDLEHLTNLPISPNPVFRSKLTASFYGVGDLDSVVFSVSIHSYEALMEELKANRSSIRNHDVGVSPLSIIANYAMDYKEEYTKINTLSKYFWRAYVDGFNSHAFNDLLFRADPILSDKDKKYKSSLIKFAYNAGRAFNGSSPSPTMS